MVMVMDKKKYARSWYLGNLCPMQMQQNTEIANLKLDQWKELFLSQKMLEIFSIVNNIELGTGYGIENLQTANNNKQSVIYFRNPQTTWIKIEI